ncbi:hypothetical protein O3P69_010017 [Scylla paramamosain]|uniref:Uncharacterized protein n=1 Tax=Scylla paramamosain TaxID=85552 RepID=A0AAW0SN35_SCYPA
MDEGHGTLRLRPPRDAKVSVICPKVSATQDVSAQRRRPAKPCCPVTRMPDLPSGPTCLLGLVTPVARPQLCEVAPRPLTTNENIPDPRPPQRLCPGQAGPHPSTVPVLTKTHTSLPAGRSGTCKNVLMEAKDAATTTASGCAESLANNTHHPELPFLPPSPFLPDGRHASQPAAALQMRLLLLLAAVVGLALAEEPLEHPVAGEDGMAEVEVEVDDDGRFDAARLLRDLFRSKDEAGAGQEDLSRYNNFVDTMFRRMNSQARTRNDPMSISLNSKKKPSGKTGKKGNKNKGKTGGDKKGKGKKGAKKGPKGDKKGDKTKRKNTRHPKDLSVDVAVGVEEEEEEEQVATMPEAGHVEARQKREVEEEQEQEQVDEADSAREARDMDLAEAAKETVETSRKNRPAGSPKAKKGPKKGKGKGKGKKGNKKNSKKQKKTKSGKRRTKKSIPKVRTSRANVVGIATLRRVGDVKVINRKDAKEIRSQFALGPVGLSVERKFGYGRDAVSRTARATSPELRGKMSILVSADGRARVSNFHIAKPSIVRVEGSLHKEVKTGADNNFMENSLNRITPFASKRLMASARSILATTTNRTS